MASAPAAESPLLSAFWGLAALEEGERRRAALSIVKLVTASQEAFEETTAKTGAAAASALAGVLCNDLSYTVRRLTRGVASSRAASRQGFALALTELLQAFPVVSTLTVLDQVLEATKFNQKSTKLEQRDGILGRVFGVLAIARSGRFAGEELAAEDAEVGVRLAHTVTELFRIASKKSWVADVAFEAIAAVTASAGPAAWAAHLSAVVLPQLAGDTRDWSPEQLSLALALDEAVSGWYPAGAGDLVLPPPVQAVRRGLSASVLQAYHLTAPAITVRGDGKLASATSGGDGDSDDEDGDEGAGMGPGGADAGGDEDSLPENAPLAAALLASTTGYPRLHSVWGRLLQRYHAGVLGAGSAGDAATLRDWSEVWRVYIDEGLVPAGPERKATAMLLLQSLLPRLAEHPAALGACLSQHLVKTLVRSAGDSSKTLHAPAVAALSALVDACKGRPAAASSAVLCLLARGHPNFDRQSHTGTVGALLGELDSESVLGHVTAAQAEFARPSDAPLYADLASTATGATAASLGLRKALGAAPRNADGGSDGGAGSDAGSNAGGHSDDEDSEEEGGAQPSRGARLTASDVRRLWALDTILSALKNPSLAPLRSPAVVSKAVAFLALHAYADVPELPEAVLTALGAPAPAASEPASAEAGKSSKKRRREAPGARGAAIVRAFLESAGLLAPGASPAEASAAGALLVADPPLSPTLRGELRSRLVSLVRDLAAAQTTPSVLPAPGAPAEANGKPSKKDGKKDKKQKQGKGGKDGKAAPLPPGALLGPPKAPAWRGIRDRQVAAAALSLELTAVVNSAWDAAAAAAGALAGLSSTAGDSEGDADAPVIAPVPAQAALAASATDDSDGEEDGESEASDSDSEGDDESSAPSGPAPSEVRSRALALAAFLRSAGELLLSAVPPPAPGAASDRDAVSRFSEPARQCLAVGGLLAQGALHLLAEAPTGGASDDSESPSAPASGSSSAALRESSSALGDVLLSLRSLMGPTAATVQALAQARAASAAGSAPASAEASKGGKKDKKGAAPAAAALAAPSAALQQASATFAALTAPFPGSSDGDDEEEDEDEEDASASDPSRAPLVLVDALLALLANASAPLREAVKAAARCLFHLLTPSCIDTMLAVVTSKGSGDDEDEEEEGSDDEEDGEGGDNKKPHAHSHEGDDEASITLDGGDLMGALLGGGDADETAAPKGGKGKKKQEEESDDDSNNDEEEDASDGEVGGDAAAAAAAAEAEMARYDSMLGDMLRQRRAAKTGARAGRLRAQHFRFRACDLLEVAVARLTATAPSTSFGPGAVDAALNGGASHAHPLVLGLPLPLLSAMRVLAARSRGVASGATPAGKQGRKGASASEEAAEGAAALFERLAGLLVRLLKAKLPLLPVDKETSATAPAAIVRSTRAALAAASSAASAASRGTGADGSAVYAPSRAGALATLQGLVALARAAPSPAFADACASASGLLLRALRAPPAPGAAATPGAAPSPASAQPSGAHLDALASAYGQLLASFVGDRHARVGPGAFRGVLGNTPALAARLLAPLGESVASGAIAKPFRVCEALQLALTGLRTAGAPWAAEQPCVIAAPAPAPVAAKSAKKPRKGSVSLTGGAGEEALSTPAPVVTTLRDFLPSVAVPALLCALTAVFKASAAPASAAADGAPTAATAGLSLSPKALRSEAVPLLSHVAKNAEALAPEGSAAAAALEEALGAAAALAAVTSAGGLRSAINGVLASAGRASVEGGAAAGAGAADSDDEEDGPSSAPAATPSGKGKGVSSGKDKGNGQASGQKRKESPGASAAAGASQSANGKPHKKHSGGGAPQAKKAKTAPAQ